MADTDLSSIKSSTAKSERINKYRQKFRVIESISYDDRWLRRALTKTLILKRLSIDAIYHKTERVRKVESRYYIRGLHELVYMESC